MNTLLEHKEFPKYLKGRNWEPFDIGGRSGLCSQVVTATVSKMACERNDRGELVTVKTELAEFPSDARLYIYLDAAGNFILSGKSPDLTKTKSLQSERRS